MDLIRTHQCNCPYCGEMIELIVDCSLVAQEYTEDCSVCCRPIVVQMNITDDDDLLVSLRREDE